jgi:hypothetical protein
VPEDLVSKFLQHFWYQKGLVSKFLSTPGARRSCQQIPAALLVPERSCQQIPQHSWCQKGLVSKFLSTPGARRSCQQIPAALLVPERSCQQNSLALLVPEDLVSKFLSTPGTRKVLSANSSALLVAENLVSKFLCQHFWCQKDPSATIIMGGRQEKMRLPKSNTSLPPKRKPSRCWCTCGFGASCATIGRRGRRFEGLTVI